jgi:hypothetical protein
VAETIEKYGARWPKELDELQIEMGCIRQGGKWTSKSGVKCGEGLPFHFERMRKLLWPKLDDHRWNSICRDAILNNKVTVLMGPGSSGKTHTAAWVHLCEYFCFPEDTCVLISSTDVRGLKLRVWGEIATLWSQAVEKFDYLPGNMLDSALAITTDSLEDCDADQRVVRDMRRGIIGVPTMTGGRFVGLAKWVGIKQKRVRLVADEAAMMGIGFLSAFSNLNKNEDFRAVVLGNPNDIYDPLGKAAEPLDGWASHLNPEKTSTWKTRFMNGVCVNLVGTDSPNFDFPSDQPTRYKYLISKEKITETVSFFGPNSYEYYAQCKGTMQIGQMNKRVLSRQMCEEGMALESEINWAAGGRTRVYFVDAAYGGDRCVGGWGEFGPAIGGKVVLLLHPPAIIPIAVGKEPEEQIAEFIKTECIGLGIPPENMGHDATGRGSLGTFLARAWSAQTNPIESGGTPTERSVSQDTFISTPYDYTSLRKGFSQMMRRLKTCKEHYVKRVTEYWFSVRYAVQAGQIRGMTDEVMEEFCMREWDRVKDDKIELETKKDMKERTGRSPDLADWCFIGETQVLTVNGLKRIDTLRVGDQIVTPFGPTEIIRTASHYVDEITSVNLSNGESLSGTGEHKVFTWKGWRSMDTLSLTPVLESVLNLPIWQFLNLFCIRDESTSFKHLVDTIKTRTGVLSRKDFYIGLSGLSIAAQFLLGCAYITKTKIGRIIESAISNYSLLPNMVASTLERGGTKQRIENECSLAYVKEIKQRERGTGPQVGEHGTRKTLGVSGSIGSRKGLSALNADVVLSRCSVEKFCSARQSAWTEGAIEMRNWCIEFAKCAPKALWLILAGQHRIAPVAVRQSRLQNSKLVYDITLRDHNVYFANGVLVSNCAGIVEMARRKGFQISKLENEEAQGSNNDWLRDLRKDQRQMNESKALVFS